MTVKGGESACYRCLFPEPPPPAAVVSCSEAGVLGPIPGTIGALQALEVIKVLTGAGRPLYDRLIQFDGAAMTFTEVEVHARADLPGVRRATLRSPSWWTTMTSGEPPNARDGLERLGGRAGAPGLGLRRLLRRRGLQPRAGRRGARPRRVQRRSRSRPCRPRICRRSWRRPARSPRASACGTSSSRRTSSTSDVVHRQSARALLLLQAAARRRDGARRRRRRLRRSRRRRQPRRSRRPSPRHARHRRRPGSRTRCSTPASARTQVRRLSRAPRAGHVGRAAAGVPRLAHPLRRAHHRGEAAGRRGRRGGAARVGLSPVPGTTPRRRRARRGGGGGHRPRGRRGPRRDRAPAPRPRVHLRDSRPRRASAREA